MPRRQPKYPIEEHAQRGRDIYERVVRPQVEAGNKGKIVAIDIDTESFEIAADSLTACHRLLERLPEAQIWSERVGYPAVVRFGPRRMGALK